MATIRGSTGGTRGERAVGFAQRALEDAFHVHLAGSRRQLDPLEIDRMSESGAPPRESRPHHY